MKSYDELEEILSDYLNESPEEEEDIKPKKKKLKKKGKLKSDFEEDDLPY